MYEKELKIAIAAVKASAITFRKYFGTKTEIKIKDGDYRNVASLADRKIEKDIKSFLSKHFPDYGFLGEENGHSPAASEYCWILDPIDGTTNYIQGNAECVISLCLQKNNRTILAAVYAPVTSEFFTAVAGHGAKRNGKPIHVSKTIEIKKCYSVLGWSRNFRFGIKTFSKLLPNVLTIRVAGSGTFALCGVAKGSYDFFVGKGQPAIWDIAAGELLVREAGGIVSDNSKMQIAGNKVLAAKLFKLFK